MVCHSLFDFIILYYKNPTFPTLRALAYTTGLGYHPTCD